MLANVCMLTTVVIAWLVTDTMALATQHLYMWIESPMIKEIVLNKDTLKPKGSGFNVRCNPKDVPERDAALQTLPQKYVFLSQGEIPPMFQTFLEDPIIPPQVSKIRLRWHAENNAKISYNFTVLHSYNSEVMYNPLLNIPRYGLVPNTPSDLSISLPCTKRKAGLVRFSIQIQFHSASAKAQHSANYPIGQKARKYCISADDISKMNIRCYCRSKCRRKQQKNSSAAKNLNKRMQRSSKKGDANFILQQRLNRCQKRCRTLCSRSEHHGRRCARRWRRSRENRWQLQFRNIKESRSIK